jgi:hypothetical protein
MGNIKLEKIPSGKGFILIGNDLPSKCIKCGNNLGDHFFYCNEIDTGICRKCEIGSNKNLCGYRELKEHEHFNITMINKQNLTPEQLKDIETKQQIKELENIFVHEAYKTKGIHENIKIKEYVNNKLKEMGYNV